MKTVGIILVLIACLLVAYAMLDSNGMGKLKKAGRNVADDAADAGRSVMNTASNVPMPGDEEETRHTADADADGQNEDAEVQVKQAPPTDPVIELPGDAAEFAWGEPIREVRQEIDVAFAREAAGTMLQTRPEDRTTYRYFFNHNGLYQVQVRYEPREGRSVDQIHGDVMEEMKRKYGHLVDSRRTFWADGFTALSLSLDRQLGWVQLEFRHQPR